MHVLPALSLIGSVCQSKFFASHSLAPVVTRHTLVTYHHFFKLRNKLKHWSWASECVFTDRKCSSLPCHIKTCAIVQCRQLFLCTQKQTTRCSGTSVRVLRVSQPCFSLSTIMRSRGCHKFFEHKNKPTHRLWLRFRKAEWWNAKICWEPYIS